MVQTNMSLPSSSTGTQRRPIWWILKNINMSFSCLQVAKQYWLGLKRNLEAIPNILGAKWRVNYFKNSKINTSVQCMCVNGWIVGETLSRSERGRSFAGRALCHFQGLVSFPISLSTLRPSKFSFFASFPRSLKFLLYLTCWSPPPRSCPHFIHSDGHHPPARSWTSVQCLRSPFLRTPPPFSRCFGGFSPLSTFRFNFFHFLSNKQKFWWTLANTHTNPILYSAESLKWNLNPKPRHWNFLSAQVTTVLPRDLDSLPSAREAAALGEWIKSNYSFHVMRWTAFET